MSFSCKCIYEIYKKVKTTMTNLIYEKKKSSIYGKRLINKLQH